MYEYRMHVLKLEWNQPMLVDPSQYASLNKFWVLIHFFSVWSKMKIDFVIRVRQFSYIILHVKCMSWREASREEVCRGCGWVGKGEQAVQWRNQRNTMNSVDVTADVWRWNNLRACLNNLDILIRCQQRSQTLILFLERGDPSFHCDLLSSLLLIVFASVRVRYLLLLLNRLAWTTHRTLRHTILFCTSQISFMVVFYS